ncbi:CDP-diacylglycerol pyrophosphatase [Mycobacterium tuberculosis]|uniref:CDP-diacylglycerol pyrophosphatase n=17 Tax=Mycobacterium tuberculosis complex TaxID=77643 RepID=CDH_MYCTA|nr:MULTISPECIES: CDP-diacylglycerol diphosphatase [Mycobacterium]NP_216805.1 CDP-diacylglycerol pyrophosphatase [Mycobacterium tuberculosis H37Rv]A1KKY1.1 RecName: Full=CDP-diacylglycerol pyrophosphatase; AltName: Full=CDP-diacylglycerol phosphatidylhydrolase; AltName: Full=CDP-diglyceride hydrolase [Mycobacterium tuberculosis variant bovis BCG str. Pasteur 1173P2]A5U4X2.1 RecName: Full=CDP-diacylglycerol pyrophosphatase; AltName: Full=CDP-diacylglycerol phosphatidylhydrolase; AltName: Full=CDP-
MPKSRRAVSLSVLIGAVIAALAGALIAVTVPARPNRPEADREALWKIVHDRCEFGYRRTGAYAPCTFVDEQSGTALYKADFDPYQFLLIPLARITGIEDPALRESAGRNYLYDAWAARFLVTARLNNSLPESDVVLTINPKNARTQDQLHIHISCSSPTTSAALRNVDTSEYVGWKQLPIDLGGRRFQGLAVDTKAFESRNLFRDIYLKVTADGKKMENASIAVANVAQDQFLLLLAEGTEDQPVAAETLQDHDCSITKS